jgi:hypothetical protein
VVNPIEVEYEDSSDRIITTVGGITPIGIFANNGEELRIGQNSLTFSDNDGAWLYAMKYNGIYSLYFKGTLVNPLSVGNGGTGASTAAIARANLEALGTADIVNNLTSTATDKPLSAAQGKALKDAADQAMAISEYGDIQIVSATSGASLYGNNFYIRFNRVVFIFFGFKLENATIGKQYDIHVNVPNTCTPPNSSMLSAVATNGDLTGSVNISYSQSNGFSVYADKAGTTYAIGSLTYIIR